MTSIQAGGRTVDHVTRAVLFDFYGTLARAVSWGPRTEEVFSQHGITLAEGAWDLWGDMDVIDGFEHVEHSASRDAYVAWELHRLRERALACGVGPDDIEALVRDLHVARKTFTLEAYPEVAPVLEELRRRSVMVAVCSNWDWDLDRALSETGLDSLVDVAVTSARAGARKPHPRIYRYTLDLCAVDPANALFVGDSWGPDVEGPRTAGLRPVYVRRNDDRRQPPEGDAVISVPDLRPVLDLV